MLQVTFASGSSGSLSMAERLQATSDTFRRASVTPDAVANFVLGAGLLLLAAALIAWTISRARRLGWVRHHCQRLRAAGLHDDEVALVRRLAARADTPRLPLLGRMRGAFDEAAAAHIRHLRPEELRRDELSRVLAVRRRVPFDQRLLGVPTFVRGQPLRLCARTGPETTVTAEAYVLGTPPHALQVALTDPKGPLGGNLLGTGSELVLIVRRDHVPFEARVRVRGRCDGRTLQLLLDRPATLTPSRVRIAWQGADERVRVEMVERFSERLIADDVPVHSALLLASSSEGVILRFEQVRPRHGEAIRVVAGPFAGFYRGFVTLQPHGRGGDVFAIRRTGERSEPVPGTRRNAETAAPVTPAEKTA